MVWLLGQLAQRGVTPKALAGPIWGAWAKRFGTMHEEHRGQEKIGPADQVACWTCGLVKVERELQAYTCRECGGGSGLRLRKLDSGEVKGGLGTPLLEELTGDWGPGVGLDAVVVLQGFVEELQRVKGKVKQETWVSVPLMTAKSTIIVTDTEDHSGEAIPKSQPQAEWSFRGTMCPECGRFKMVDTIIIEEADSPLHLCPHLEKSDSLVTKEMGARSVLQCGTQRLVGGVPVRSRDHEPVELDRASECHRSGGWVHGFTPHEPKRPDVDKGVTDIVVLTL